MTYFSLHVILNAVKNPAEELTVHILFTLVVGYFAYAQYDVKAQVEYFADAQYDVFFVFASVAKQSPGRAEVYGVYLAYFFEGIAAALRASQ